MTDVTSNRGLPLPHPDNSAAEDALRLRTAISMIDADIAAALAAIDPAVEAAIGALIGAAPATLDTLAEIAAALGNDPNLATTLTSAIAGKQAASANLTALSDLASVGNLTAMAGLTGAADKAAYFTAAGALALMTVTAKGRALLASADETAMRAFLGLGTAALLAAGTGANNVVQLDASGRLPAVDGTVPVGTTIWVNGTVAPSGFLKENGALILRSAAPALWAYAQASGRVVTEAQWASGNSGAFSSGDLATTFRIPDSRGEFVRALDDGRGVDAGRSLGGWQADDFKSHQHQQQVGTEINQAGGSNRSSTGSAYNLSGIYTASAGGSETRPRNITKLACIRY
ncbi:phage tail protein [Rhodopseudomonas sp. BR0G17]|uniref:phage tail protein n=1 Tax=Rhodopseudomonas sp. BR0G17 TaxID=2269368 RepID=UPI0013E07AC8|nr:phage tail protein [Rhodopseudomonas sp. BR0G17]NEW96908.1 hypothetical protein [Rhodopseudomonas sp. BR0G17]